MLLISFTALFRKAETSEFISLKVSGEKTFSLGKFCAIVSCAYCSANFSNCEEKINKYKDNIS